MIRVVVHYSGRVQGVGFRWTAANLAKDYAVAGYVQNLPDGRVRLETQGERAEVMGLLEAIDSAMAGNIKSKDLAEHEPDPRLGSADLPNAFEIRR